MIRVISASSTGAGGLFPLLTTREISISCRGAGAGMLRELHGAEQGLDPWDGRDHRGALLIPTPLSHPIPSQRRMNCSQLGKRAANAPCLSQRDDGFGRGSHRIPSQGSAPLPTAWGCPRSSFLGEKGCSLGKFCAEATVEPCPVPTPCPRRREGGREGGKPMGLTSIPQL